MIIGVTEARRTSRSARWRRSQHKLDAIVAADPDTDVYGASLGAGSAGKRATTGASIIALKPWDQRVGGTAQQYHRAAAPQIRRGLGRYSLHAGGAGRPCRRTDDQDRVPVHACRMPISTNCIAWAPKVLAKLQKLPMLRDVTSDQQIRRHHGHPDDRPRPGGALRDAAGN